MRTETKSLESIKGSKENDSGNRLKIKNKEEQGQRKML
jgi:hypothetical protein